MKNRHGGISTCSGLFPACKGFGGGCDETPRLRFFVLFFLNGDELVREHHYNERSDLCLGEICISLWINDLILGAGSQFG